MKTQSKLSYASAILSPSSLSAILPNFCAVHSIIISSGGSFQPLPKIPDGIMIPPLFYLMHMRAVSRPKWNRLLVRGTSIDPLHPFPMPELCKARILAQCHCGIVGMKAWGTVCSLPRETKLPFLIVLLLDRSRKCALLTAPSPSSLSQGPYFCYLSCLPSRDCSALSLHYESEELSVNCAARHYKIITMILYTSLNVSLFEMQANHSHSLCLSFPHTTWET